MRHGAVLAVGLALCLGLAGCGWSQPDRPTRGQDDTRALMAILNNPAGAPTQPVPQAQAPQPQAPASPRPQPVAPAVQVPVPQQTAPQTPVFQAPADPAPAGPTPAEPPRSVQPMPPQPTQTPAPAPVAQADSPVGSLSPQTLEPGACGLFLWVRQRQAHLVFFSGGRSNEARMHMDGQDVTLQRLTADGTMLFGQHARQTFLANGRQIALNVVFQPRSDLASGAAVPQGTLRVEDNEGWSFVMPVAGLIACQPV